MSRLFSGALRADAVAMLDELFGKKGCCRGAADDE
jgi:hypothetical protein